MLQSGDAGNLENTPPVTLNPKPRGSRKPRGSSVLGQTHLKNPKFQEIFIPGNSLYPLNRGNYVVLSCGHSGYNRRWKEEPVWMFLWREESVKSHFQCEDPKLYTLNPKQAVKTKPCKMRADLKQLMEWRGRAM